MFVLDPRLEGDTFWVDDLPLCRLLLMNDSQFPWLILVPRVQGISELHQLSIEQTEQFYQESRLCSTLLQTLFSPYKLNIAALGNVVNQLHIHHVARFENDAAWPAPIWGRQPVVPYPGSTGETRVAELQRYLKGN